MTKQNCMDLGGTVQQAANGDVCDLGGAGPPVPINGVDILVYQDSVTVTSTFRIPVPPLWPVEPVEEDVGGGGDDPPEKKKCRDRLLALFQADRYLQTLLGHTPSTANSALIGGQVQGGAYLLAADLSAQLGIDRQGNVFRSRAAHWTPLFFGVSAGIAASSSNGFASDFDGGSTDVGAFLDLGSVAAGGIDLVRSKSDPGAVYWTETVNLGIGNSGGVGTKFGRSSGKIYFNIVALLCR
jgi:hypothetical protein